MFTVRLDTHALASSIVALECPENRFPPLTKVPAPTPAAERCLAPRESLGAISGGHKI